MLPYTAEALFAQFAQYNQTYWPAPLVAATLALAALLLAVRPTAASGRLVAALLAAGWMWTGIAYHLMTFATLNFVAPAYSVLFLLQGFLLLWTGVIRGRLGFRFRPNAPAWGGLALAAAALLLYPLADALAGFGWESARIAGIAPAPTAAFTLGLLLLVDGRVHWHLAVLPLLWAAATGATAWILSIPQDMVFAAAALAALGLMVQKSRRFSAVEGGR